MLGLKDKRGMTLIEILIAIAIASIMMLGVYEVFVAQKNLYVSTDVTASAQDNARVALDSIQRDLSHAGFGVDPSLAFVFIDPITGVPADFDQTNGPDTLRFLARERNPLPGAGENGCPAGPATDIGRHFYWLITRANPRDGITIHVCPGFELYRGTFLLAMCGDGGTYAFMRYNGGKLSSALETDVTISPVNNNLFVFYTVSDRTYPAGGGNNFAKACFSDGHAQLHRINYYRYYIRPAEVNAATGVETVPPYLMLDTGLDLDDNNSFDDDHIPVAEGIEDMQVVYNLWNGNCAGNPGCKYNEVENMPNYTNIYRPVFCDDPYSEVTCIDGSPSARSDDLPGNTVSVRVSIVARTAIPDPIQGSSATEGPGGFPLLDVENHIIPVPKPLDRYRRLLFQTTVQIPNTLSQQAFPFL